MLFPLLAFALPFGLADQTYKSRPDLTPPKLNITIPCSACDTGYLFVSPYSGHPDTLNYYPVQPGNYILRDDGDVVFSGFSYWSPWNANFQPSKWKGQDVLFAFEGLHDGPHGHGLGHHTLLNNRYETVKELRAGGHYLSDKHEFIINDDQETALIQIWQPVQRNLSKYGGDLNHTWVVDAIFQELDIETGKVLFEWHSLDHVSPDDAILPLTTGPAGNGSSSTAAWDYFHINSVEKGTDGNYLVSARHISTLFKINGTDGSIIWRLGAHRSDFKLGPEVEFGFQHHARYLHGGNSSVSLISLFDNSYYGSGQNETGTDVQIYPYSRGKYIAIDHETHHANLVKEFIPPNKSILTKHQGSTQSLPNGNVLINWGSEGQITEYTSNGTITLHAHLDSGELANNVQNYRAFRYHWTGTSSETPALVAHKIGNVVKAFVSWNGDTRVKSWRFTWKETGGNQPHTGTGLTKRTGFETVFSISPKKSHTKLEITAQGLDCHGTIIGESDLVVINAKATKDDDYLQSIF
ncbi:hypothetical protein Golomagni_06197 [Golovinomyces magnicellulatus]|nr:hypothetical protein Golomagni_06197 [Golovinomyces magnicellulatus]